MIIKDLNDNVNVIKRSSNAIVSEKYISLCNKINLDDFNDFTNSRKYYCKKHANSLQLSMPASEGDNIVEKAIYKVGKELLPLEPAVTGKKRKSNKRKKAVVVAATPDAILEATNVKIRKEEEDDIDPMPKPFMHLPKNYVVFQENIVSESFDESMLFDLYQFARNTIEPQDYDEDVVIHIIKDIMNIDTSMNKFKALIKKLTKEQEEKRLSTSSSHSSSGVSSFYSEDFCSRQCYKDFQGQTLRFTLWTKLEEYEVKDAMITHNKNFCKIAEIIKSKTCSEIFNFAKDLEVPCKAKKNIGIKAQKMNSSIKMNVFMKRNNKHKDSLSSFYQPCNHKGECDENCPCFNGNNFCEKLCGCEMNCKNRFEGCSCSAQCDSKRCPCFLGLRECDANLCKCRHGKDEKRCQNMNIQLEKKKNVEVKKSSIAGFGCFAKEIINKDDFIIEYSGELISKVEDERREEYYRELKLNYVFSLCKEFSVDGFYVGNECRFINHSENPNCYVKIVTVNCDKRIAFFAKKNIQINEELLVDYHYDLEHKEIYFNVGKSTKKAKRS